MAEWEITRREREILRGLAAKQREYSQLPIMAERERRWYLHNDLRGEVPMVHFETWTCEGDLIAPLACESPTARGIELSLLRNMLNHERIDDDRVVASTYDIGWWTYMTLFDLPVRTTNATDARGGTLGHRFLHPMTDLPRDLKALKPTVRGADREGTLRWKAFVEDLLGDILPVRLAGCWLGASLAQDVVHLMGMEAMIFAMVDYPAEFHELMRRITESHLSHMKWLEAEGLLLPNSGNNGLAQGSFGFSHDLPEASASSLCGYSASANPAATSSGAARREPLDALRTQANGGLLTQAPRAGAPLRTTDLWGYMDSQETVSISPAMYGEFFFPYYRTLAESYGLLSYGCCEPVHAVWTDYLSKLPNLRKVSISPWCNEEFMGEALQGTATIYHRKPSPIFVGVGSQLDESEFRAHILRTIRCAKGCRLEFSFRDVYKLGGDSEKPRRAVQIVRELLEEHWG